MERLAFGTGQRADSWELAIHLARYGSIADLCPGKRVLDIACGEGFGAYLMVQKWGAGSVLAADISPIALDSARRNFDDPRISWIELNADTMTVESFKTDGGNLAQFDLIVSLETIEHLDDPARFLRILGSLLAPGGTLCVSWPNDEWYYGEGVTYNLFHKHVFSFEQFRSMSEEILGPAAQYLIGTPMKGICSIPLETAKHSSNSTTETVRCAAPQLLQQLLPAQSEIPSTKDCLYFLAMWGVTPPARSGVDSATAGAFTPTTPELALKIENLRPPRQASGAKPTVVLVADVPGWAYCNISQNVKRYLSGTYDVQIVYVGDYDHWSALYFDVFWERRPSIVHVFWREFLFESLQQDVAFEVSQRYKLSYDAFLDRMAAASITTSVFDHLNLDRKAVLERQDLFWLVDAYFVSSDKLLEIYSRSYRSAPDLVIEDGVDLELFQPARTSRFEESRELVVGWAGNSNWCRDSAYDPKGFHTILKPALDILTKEGMRVRGNFADASVKRIPRAEMGAFYSTLDVYVCTSEIEGTPNPVLEAMACGVPIVSTDVGIVPQVFGPRQREFILKERTPSALAAALKRLALNRSVLTGLSEENLAQIKSWSWRHKMNGWLTLFRLAMSRADSRSINRKRSLYAGKALPGRKSQLGPPKNEGTVSGALVGDLYQEIDRLSILLAQRERMLHAQGQELAARVHARRVPTSGGPIN